MVAMLADVPVEPLHCLKNYTTLIEGTLPRIDLLCMKNAKWTMVSYFKNNI